MVKGSHLKSICSRCSGVVVTTYLFPSRLICFPLMQKVLLEWMNVRTRSDVRAPLGALSELNSLHPHPHPELRRFFLAQVCTANNETVGTSKIDLHQAIE